jgi:hypothetical protein
VSSTNIPFKLIAISYFLGITSITTLTVLAFERYLIIAQPLYSNHLNFRNVTYLLVSIWLYSLTLTTPPLLGWGEYVNEAANIRYVIDDLLQIRFLLNFFLRTRIAISCFLKFPWMWIIKFCLKLLYKAHCRNVKPFQITSKALSTKSSTDEVVHLL